MKLVYLVFLGVFSVGSFGHQPIKTDIDDQFSKLKPYQVDEPQISKAIFAELSGSDHFYRVQSDQPFDFYVGITQAKPDGCELTRTFSFQILDENFNEISTYLGDPFDWWSWYESFGKKWYWVGPETGEDFLSTDVFEAGTYYVRVFNSNNQGKYVLAVGDDENFTLGVIARTIAILPGINREFWNKPSANCLSNGA